MINSGKSVGQGPALPTELPKRKRGRPRKQPQDPAGPLPPKKPRGRPKGSKKLNTGSGQMVHTMAEKKPRGRPRKWLIVQEDAYQKAGTEGRINPSSATACPTTEDSDISTATDSFVMASLPAQSSVKSVSSVETSCHLKQQLPPVALPPSAQITTLIPACLPSYSILSCAT
ncbi:uncharacterized protein LOC144586749 isoform X1 [Pogona vitticeps]